MYKLPTGLKNVSVILLIDLFFKDGCFDASLKFTTIIPSTYSGVWFELSKTGKNSVMKIDNDNVQFEGLLSQIGEMTISDKLTVQNIENTARSWSDKNILNYKTNTDIEDGLRKFISWFKIYHKI